MKILKIVNSNDGGGVFNCEKQFINILKEKGVLVDLIITGNGNNLKEYIAMANAYWLLPEIKGYNSKNYLGKLKDIYESYKYAKFYRGVIFENNNLKYYNAIIFRRQYFNFLAYYLGQKYSCPTFWHMAGVVKSKLLKKVYTFMMRGLDVIIIANSKYTKSTIGNYCKHVIYPGFDIKRTANMDTLKSYRIKYNIADDAIVYGVASRIYPGKAIDLVIKAFLNVNLTNRYLFIAGKIVDAKYWEELMPLLTSSKIIYLGEIDNINEFYASIDILVNGGKEAEAFGISIAEALGSALPIIAFNLGGPMEMIEDGENGWLISNPTIEEYENAFIRSNVDKKTIRDMGKVSLFKSSQFTAERNVDDLIRLINRF